MAEFHDLVSNHRKHPAEDRVRELEGSEAEPPCPRCRKPMWQLQSSERDTTLGVAG